MIFDPFEEMRRIHERINRLFEEFEKLTPRPFVAETFPVDVIDEGENIKVIADLPGFRKEDIELWIEDGTLVIKAVRKEEREEKAESYIRRERKFGEVYRKIAIPVEVDVENIKATYNNGVLEVVLPKTEKAKKKVIKIE